MITEAILATAVGGAAAGFAAKVLIDRWKAPEKWREQSDERYVSQLYCEQCQRLTEERYTAVASRFDAFEQANREEHQRILDRIDHVADMIRRSNGHHR